MAVPASADERNAACCQHERAEKRSAAVQWSSEGADAIRSADDGEHLDAVTAVARQTSSVG
eukprot:4138573-Prymnesium_polylepis.1